MIASVERRLISSLDSIFVSIRGITLNVCIYQMDSVLVAFMMIVTTLIFGLIYSSFDPAEFGFTDSPMDPWYFSFTTMSTVGYGDFSPKTDRAKRMVMFHQALLIMESAFSWRGLRRKCTNRVI